MLGEVADGATTPNGDGGALGVDGSGVQPVSGEQSAPTHVTLPRPATVISETTVELEDRQVGSDAPRRDRLFAAASAKGVPLRTILTVDAVVIVTWLLYRLVGRLKEIILWILIAAFVALVLNPAVTALQRRRMRRGVAVGIVYLVAVVAFFGLLGLFGYPLVNSVTHVATQ